MNYLLKTPKSKIITIISLLILIVFGFLFYWFQYRPMSIRRFCYKTTYGAISEQIRSNEDGDKDWKAGKSWISNPMTETINDDWGWWYPVKGVETRYIKCFLERGMRPEKPFSQIIDPVTL